MNRTPNVVSDRVYQSFEPRTQWATEPAFDTLVVYLPGFRKEQVRVQVTTTRKLRIKGERPVGGNRWIHFEKEFPIDSNYDYNEITARFEGGTLYIKHPKIITPAEPQAATVKPSIVSEDPKPQRPTTEPQAQKSEDKQATTQVPPVSTVDPKQKEDKTTPEPQAKKPQNVKNGPDQPASAQVFSPKKSVDKQEKEKSKNGKVNADADKKQGKEKRNDKVASIDAGKTSEKENGTSTTGGTADASGSAIPEISKDKSDGLGKVENHGDSDQASAKTDKLASGLVKGKNWPENYKHVLGGLVMELKNPKKLTNLVLVVLLLLVLGLYARNAMIRSIWNSEN